MGPGAVFKPMAQQPNNQFGQPKQAIPASKLQEDSDDNPIMGPGAGISSFNNPIIKP